MKKRNVLIMVLLIFSIVILGVKTNVNAQGNVTLSKETEMEIEKNRAVGIFDLPDDELEQYFIDEVNRRTSASWTLNTMPESELQILDDIKIEGSKYNVKSLDGLDYYIQNGFLSKIKFFLVQDTQITDISPILNWPGLISISVENTPIGDVDLSNAILPNLDGFMLKNTNTSDVKGLDKLPVLSTLYIMENNLTDISFVKGLDLLDLDLSGNKITDISPIAEMNNTDFAALYLNDNLIEDFTPATEALKMIANRPGEFTFFNNRISDYTFLMPYWNDIASGALHWALDDEQHIVVDLGYIEDLSEVPTTFDIILPDGTVETINLGIDVSSITDYKDYSFNTPYNIDIPTPGGYSSTFPIVGDITVNFSYVAPIPLTPLDPSIPISVDPADPDKPEDSINTSDSSNKEIIDNENNNKEESVVKKLIQTGKENIVIIVSFIILLISLRIVILNKRV